MMDKKLLELISKAVSTAVGKKFDEMKLAVEDAKKEDANEFRGKEIEAGERSIMKEERIKSPFVKLGSDMEKFCEALKVGMKRAPLLTDAQKAAFNEGNDEDGGFTVPEELETAILSYEMEESIVRSRATIKTMKSETWKQNKLDQTSNSYGGVTVSWVGESATASDQEFEIGQISLVAKKMLLLTTESREIIKDSNIDFANYVVQVFGMAMTYAEDYTFLRGTGIGQPLGIITDTQIQVVQRAVANQVAYADVIGMKFSLKPQFRRRAVWIGSTGAMTYLEKLVDGDSRPLFLESMREGSPDKLAGRPFIETEKLPALGTKGDLVLVDLGFYYIGDREGITVDASIHDRFRYDEITVRMVKRLDGQMAMKEAAVILDVPAS